VKTLAEVSAKETPAKQEAGRSPAHAAPPRPVFSPPLIVQRKCACRVARRKNVLRRINPSNLNWPSALPAIPYDPIQITSPGLGERALYHLATALSLRLEKRNFLGPGRNPFLASPPADGKFHMVLKASKNEARPHEGPR
jgi:hypothetical protein